jgi:hypothetical protein
MNCGDLDSYCNRDPFRVPLNSDGFNEITEEADGSYKLKDCEVFAIIPQ